MTVKKQECGNCGLFSVNKDSSPVVSPFGDLGRPGLCCLDGVEAVVDRTYEHRTPIEAVELGRPVEMARRLATEMREKGTTCWRPPRQLSVPRD